LFPCLFCFAAIAHYFGISYFLSLLSRVEHFKNHLPLSSTFFAMSQELSTFDRVQDLLAPHSPATMAAYLHPARKHLGHCSLDQIQAVVSKLITMIHAQEADQAAVLANKPPSASSEFCSKRPKQDARPHVLSLEDNFGDTEVDAQHDIVESVEDEVRRYHTHTFQLQQPSESLSTFWQREAANFPRIAKAARPCIIAQASSIASERFFGSAVRVDTRFRACMLPRTLNLILFAQTNIFGERISGR